MISRKWQAHVAILGIIASLAVVAACSSPTWEDPLQPSITWVLESINGNPIIKEVPIVLTIGDDWVGGHDGCNSYWFSDEYDPPFAPVVTGSNGSFMEGEFLGGHTGSTALFCEGIEGIMEQTDAYDKALREGSTFRIQDNQLEILDNDGQTTLVFVRQPPLPGHQPNLAGTQWIMLDGSDPFILAFLDDKVAIGIGECQHYRAEYHVSNRLLQFHSMRYSFFRRPCSDWWFSFNSFY